MAVKKSVPEAEVIQNRQFIRVDRYGHFWPQWTNQKDFIYPVNQTAGFLIFLRKIMEKISFFAWKCSLIVRHSLNLAMVSIGKD